jgi:hypothetical protein
MRHRAHGKNECYLFLVFLALCLEPYALCREIEERSLARAGRQRRLSLRNPVFAGR